MTADGTRLLQAVKADLYEQEGALAQALECYFNALSELRALGRSVENPEILEFVADIYIQLGELDKASCYAEDALASARQQQNRRLEAELLSLLGLVCRLLEDEGRAWEYQRGAWKLSLALGDQHVQAKVLLQFGLLSLTDQPAQALDYFRRGYNVACENGLSREKTALRLGVAQALAASGHEVEALAGYQSALELAQTYGYCRLEAEAYEALAGHFKGAREFEVALGHYEKFYSLSQTLYQQQMSERTRTLSLSFDLEQAEKTAALERSKNAELARVNTELQAKSEQNAELLGRLRAQALRLEQQARQDALTGLANRRHLEEALARAFDEATRYAQPLCVALADIDDFKFINDSFSHAVGDAVLGQIADIFRRFVRAPDLVARYGGEEFAVVFPQTSLEGGKTVCERIRDTVAAHPWQNCTPTSW